MEVQRKKWKELHLSAQKHYPNYSPSTSKEKFKETSKEKSHPFLKNNNKLFNYKNAPQD